VRSRGEVCSARLFFQAAPQCVHCAASEDVPMSPATMVQINDTGWRASPRIVYVLRRLRCAARSLMRKWPPR